MRKFVLMALVLIVASAVAFGEDAKPAKEKKEATDAKYAVFGGWQFTSIDTQGAGRQSSTTGFDADVAYKAMQHVSFVLDLSGAYKNIGSGGSKTILHGYNVLLGPRFSCKTGKVTPFAELLMGFNHTSVAVGPVSAISKGFAFAPGAGIDVAVRNNWSLRLFKFDYLLDRVGYNHGTNSNLNNVRISSGLVYSF